MKERVYIRKPNDGEIDYWQNIAYKSNSFNEMLDIHKKSDSTFPNRSDGWFRKYLNLPFILSSEEEKKRRRQERIHRTNKLVESLSFIKEVISLDYSKHTKISYICKEGHFQSPTTLRNHKACTTCSLEKRKQEVIERRIDKEKERNEQIKQKKLDKLKRVDEFFQNNEWKNFKRTADWPICNDIINLRKYDKFKYEAEYNQITYFEYKSPGAKPPIEPKENHRWCKYCREEKHFDDFRKGYICKPCAKEYRRENYSEIERKSAKKKYHSDPMYRLESVITTHVWSALKDFNKIKDKHFKEYVGVTREELKIWIESLMTEKMTWDNYGTYWVIQHIIPRAWKENIDDVYKLNYYKNLIPYEFSPNASLSDNIVLSQLNDYHFTDKRMKYFLDKAWNEDRLYENVGKTKLQYLLSRESIGVKKVDMGVDTWQEWKWRKETAIKNAKEALEKSFTPELMNKLNLKL